MLFSSYDQALKKTPGRTLVLEPWVFADSWEKKPREAVCVGLRLMSEAEKTTARAESGRVAIELHPEGGPNAVDAFNDLLLRHCVAFGICDPNDIMQPWHLMDLAEEAVRIALTSRGARFIYEAIERYEIESSALSNEIEDVGMEELILALQEDALLTLPSNRSALARRLLQYVLEEIRTVSDRAA